MKTIQPNDAKFKVLRAIEIARDWLSQAESTLATAKGQLRLAKQRRKAAKLAARRARKQFRLAREQVAALQLSVENLEAKRLKLSAAPAKAKAAKTSAKKPRRVRSVKRITASPATAVKKKTPAKRRSKAKPVARPAIGSEELLSAAAPELETPLEMRPLSAHKPTPQIIEAVQEIFSKSTDQAPVESPAPEAGIFPESPATTTQP